MLMFVSTMDVILISCELQMMEVAIAIYNYNLYEQCECNIYFL